MKRIALLTVLLLVVGLTAGFAIDVKPTVSVTGNATVTFGFDLDTSDAGFSNAADASFTLNLLPADGTDTHAGTGDVFGSITISNIEFYWTDGNAATFGPADADISAKLVAGPLWIGVFSAPDFAIDKVAAIEADADAADDVVDDESGGDLAPDVAGAGTSVNGTFGPVTAGLRVLSQTDWNTMNNIALPAWGVEGYADLKVDPVTFGAVAFYDELGNMGFGGSVGLTAGPIVLSIGFDGQNPNGGTFDFEVGAGLTFTVVKDVTLATNVVYGDAFDGAADATSDIDLKVVFTEPAAAGLVDGLDASLTVYALDFTAGMEYEAILAGGYKVALNDAQSVRPFFSFTYGDASETTEGLMKATVGLEMNLFPLTTLTLQYASGNLSATTPVMGDVTFATKVTY